MNFRQNLFDRVVGALDPARGLARMHARARLDAATGNGSYDGGRRDRRPLKRWKPGEGSADADTLQDLPDLRSRSRDLRRNAPIATGALATKTTGIVGEGLRLQASINGDVLGITPEQADEFEREQEREWEIFCNSVDFSRVQSLDELQQLALTSALESGDVFGIRRYRKDPGDAYGTKLQLIEADRVSNPDRKADTDTLAGGVEVDKDGVPIKYHVSSRHPGNLRTAALKWEAVRARDDQGRPLVLHLFERTRPEQTRGVPMLAPVVEHLQQLSTYTKAEVDAAVIQSFVTGIVQTPNDEEGADPVVGERDSTLAANEVKLGQGAIISLAPGETFTSVNPSRPNGNAEPFLQAFCREIGVALELPTELLLKHFTASYSASRAALEMAWQTFRKNRCWFAYRFCQPLYEWMMEEAVASGRLNRPGFFADPLIRAAWCGAEWIGPQRASINPYQEAQADALDIETGVKTREQVCMERTGGEIEKKTDQLIKEQAAREPLRPATPPPGQQQPGAQQDQNDQSESDDDTEDETQPKRSAAR
jgi:lambda family phage portal protein